MESIPLPPTPRSTQQLCTSILVRGNPNSASAELLGSQPRATQRWTATVYDEERSTCSLMTWDEFVTTCAATSTKEKPRSEKSNRLMLKRPETYSNRSLLGSAMCQPSWLMSSSCPRASFQSHWPMVLTLPYPTSTSQP